MDKVLRYFTIKEETLYMHSRVEGEFGVQQLICSASPLGDTISQTIVAGSAPVEFAFRLGEMNYFLQILSLFNPKNQVDYGLQETSQQETQL